MYQSGDGFAVIDTYSPPSLDPGISARVIITNCADEFLSQNGTEVSRVACDGAVTKGTEELHSVVLCQEPGAAGETAASPKSNCTPTAYSVAGSKDGPPAYLTKVYGEQAHSLSNRSYKPVWTGLHFMRSYIG